MNKFTPLSKKSEEFSTYKVFFWSIKIGEDDLEIGLECFLLSNKRIISLNREIIFSGSKPYFKDFEWAYNWKKHVISIHNSKKSTDLLVDGLSFNSMYELKVHNRMYQQPEEVKIDQPIAKNGKFQDEDQSAEKKTVFTEDKPENKARTSYDFDRIF